MIANGESPLYNQFKELKLDYFERESVYELISKVMECGEESKRLTHQLTGGHPFYIVSIARLDILQRIEDRYYIEDKVFKMWLDLRKNGELGESPKDKPVEIYLRTRERKYLKAKTELGKAKESEIREKISKSGLINMLASVSIVIWTHRSERCEDLVEALQQAGKFCRNG